MTFPIPANLAATAARPDAAELRDWVSGVPGAVRMLAECWLLRVGAPFEPGGQCPWVALVVDASGAELVVKVAWSHPEALHEADVLQLWHGGGAVLLHAAHSFGSTNAMLLERCIPGTSLKAALPEEERDVVVAGLLRRLWRNPEHGHPFRPLQDHVR